jgi:hypothetical protein
MKEFLLRWAVWGLLALAPGALAQTNLLTVNASFEAGGPYLGWGDRRDEVFTFGGWRAHKQVWTFNRSAGVLNGDGSLGTRCFDAEGADWLETAANARAAVVPGRQYELRFAAKKTAVRTSSWAGIVPRLIFYRTNGTEIRRTWGDEVLGANQTTEWREFILRAVAPPEAATVGVFLDFQYQAVDANSDANPAAAFRVDDFRLTHLPDTADRIILRRAPRALEPGKDAAIKVRFIATTNRDIAIRLTGTGTNFGELRRTVEPGRSAFEWSYPVPAGAPAGEDYRWEVAVLPVGGGFYSATARSVSDTAFVDLRVAGSGSIAPAHTNLVYVGRWDVRNRVRPACAWTGSEIRARFTGTSLRARFRTTADFNAVDWVAVIDGDLANRRAFSVPGTSEVTLTVATGLSNGVHTVTFHRESELSWVCEFLGLTLDSGAGLLRPEPVPTRRIEFFGDSVTSGGDGGSLTSYATTSARELGAEHRIASKGATGVSGGFVFQYNGLYYWDRLNFNVFWTPPAGFPANPYAPGAVHPDPSNSRGAPWTGFTNWIADAVVIAWGQNDQFGGGPWEGNYREFVRQVRRVYPRAHIFMGNTVMTGGDGWFQSACEPLVRDPELNGDGRLHFRLFRPSGRGAHPSPQDHRDMALGNADYHSLAEWIEESLGWGLSFVDDAPAPLPSPRPDGAGLRLDVSGLPDCQYVVEASPNLRDWRPLATNRAAFSLSLASAGDPLQFYRSLFVGSGNEFFYQPPVPRAPSGLRVTGTSSNEVALAWTDTSRNEHRFEIERRGTTGNFVRVGTVDADRTQFVSPGLAAATEYVFRVRAVNLAGPSPWTDELRVTAEFAVLRPPENPANTIPGLSYRYFEGSWNSLPNFAALTARTNGTAAGFSISRRLRNDQFAFEFTGFVDAPADGTYTFSTASDDGSQLFIGATRVVDNDGLHGVQTRSGRIGLRAGRHAIRVTFFEQGGGEDLIVRWSGPGFAEQSIPDTRLSRNP